MSDLPDNVVAIQTKFNDAAPVEVRPRDWLACRHGHTTLDEVLRVVSCRDCGEERLDPFEVLVHLAREWRSWQQEADKLTSLRTEYQQNEQAKWERSRDRHLGAHPDHRAAFNGVLLGLGEPGVQYGGSRNQFACERCWSIFLRHDARWIVRRAPQPPPGPLKRVRA